MPIVGIQTVGTVATININNPLLNLGGSRQRRELLQALQSIRQMPCVAAVVISTAGSQFYAGSDLKEFDGDPQERQLPAVIEEIESLPVPVVAAIHGLALGSGFELALGCDARIADASATNVKPRQGFPGRTLAAAVELAKHMGISDRDVGAAEGQPPA